MVLVAKKRWWGWGGLGGWFSISESRARQWYNANSEFFFGKFVVSNQTLLQAQVPVPTWKTLVRLVLSRHHGWTIPSALTITPRIYKNWTLAETLSWFSMAWGTDWSVVLTANTAYLEWENVAFSLVTPNRPSAPNNTFVRYNLYFE